MSFQTREGFWRETFALHGSISPHVMPFVFMFGLAASGICGISWFVETQFQVRIALAIAPFEFAGTALGLLLILRTNAGHDRWWEARIVWSGIVNQSRNLVIGAMAYGPNNSEWREKLVRWAAVFPHVARLSLRGELPSSEITNLVGPDDARRKATAEHMPSFVALILGNLLHEARETLKMDGFAFIQLDRERALLIDHIGVCERIAKTPLPRAYSINIRRFITAFLLLLPFCLLHLSDSVWLVPLITMVVAYPLLSLDHIGVELEQPFSTSSLSHLPLDDISAAIERNVRTALQMKQADMIAAVRNTPVSKVSNTAEEGGQPERWIGRVLKSKSLGRRRVTLVVSQKATEPSREWSVISRLLSRMEFERGIPSVQVRQVRGAELASNQTKIGRKTVV